MRAASAVPNSVDLHRFNEQTHLRQPFSNTLLERLNISDSRLGALLPSAPDIISLANSQQPSIANEDEDSGPGSKGYLKGDQDV